MGSRDAGGGWGSYRHGAQLAGFVPFRPHSPPCHLRGALDPAGGGGEGGAEQGASLAGPMSCATMLFHGGGGSQDNKARGE